MGREVRRAVPQRGGGVSLTHFLAPQVVGAAWCPGRRLGVLVLVGISAGVFSRPLTAMAEESVAENFIRSKRLFQLKLF